ncbi:MAG: hypothetical protein WAM70_03590 [Pyrinomonadaceae bacterium]|jgi:hypothetical protein
MSSNIQYITDANGEKTAVILPIDEYREWLEDQHLIKVADETKNEPTRPLAEVLDELRRAGEIDV